QLLVWQGQPLVRRAAVTALEAGLSPVIVVTGAVDEPIREALQGLNVQIVHNPNWKEGQSTSVKAGISVLPEHIGGVVFLLADQPRVTSNLIRALVEKHAWSLSPLVAPQVDGQRATPVLFDREVFPELKKLSGDQGGRALFARYEVAWIPWQDVGLTLDIDTPEDFRRLLEEDSG
ncbi:MAG: nucleotidyltransferase family protein, partial [Anaerolineaceae bacterium]